MHFARAAYALLSVAVTAAAFSCAATGTGVGASTTATSAGGGSTGGSSSATSGSTLAGGGGGLLFDAGDSDGDATVDLDGACGLITKQAKSTPVDLYILLDKSASMSGDKWNSAQTALISFVNDPASSGLVVALGFFPAPGSPTCDGTPYKTPTVPFGVLPPNAATIVAAMSAATPNGTSTPTYPALSGAINAAYAQADAHPGDTAAVLLVTDGVPQGPASLCGGVDPTSTAAIASIATNGRSLLGVKTFVVGLPGVVQGFADSIAAAGGTGSAILVADANSQTQFAAALAQVRGEALPCTFELPSEVSGGQIDTNHVNVVITPGGGTSAVLPQDPTCSGAGWKYDDPTTPTTIVLCPKSCSALQTDLAARADIQLGCKTEIVN